jgi:predicted  nucleic acid-binding Zn-ribbon protein
VFQLESDSSRLKEEVDKSRGQVAALRKELKAVTASAEERSSELTQKFEFERRCRQQDDFDVKRLQAEVAHLNTQLAAATNQLEQAEVREKIVSLESLYYYNTMLDQRQKNSSNALYSFKIVMIVLQQLSKICGPRFTNLSGQPGSKRNSVKNC